MAAPKLTEQIEHLKRKIGRKGTQNALIILRDYDFAEIKLAAKLIARCVCCGNKLNSKRSLTCEHCTQYTYTLPLEEAREELLI